MEVVIMAAQMILGISILVGVHEAGHMLAAKAFGMRVEKFSIGFPPKLFGFKYGETEYSLGATPLGGYVKISGMIDESMDTEAMKEPPKDYEFRSKPAWQRLIVMMGGIIVNVIVGIIIYVSITFIYGDSYLSKREANKHGIDAFEVAREIGLQTGDKITMVNGRDFERFSEVTDPNVLLADQAYYTVDRNGQTLDVQLPANLLDRLSKDNGRVPFIEARSPFEVGFVDKKSGASKAGIVVGDKILEVEGKPITFYDELRKAIKGKEGRTVSVWVEREGERLEKDVVLDKDAKLGIGIKYIRDYTSVDYSFGQSLGLGTERAFGAIAVNLRAFQKMFSGDLDPRKSLAGPIGIAQIFGGSWNWLRFWGLVGLLSMILAFMNFLPIPALDGGHVAFLTYEMVSGRKPSDKFLEVSQKVGMVILLALMVFILGNDIVKAVSSWFS